LLERRRPDCRAGSSVDGEPVASVITGSKVK
jgi:hypothetical protein